MNFPWNLIGFQYIELNFWKLLEHSPLRSIQNANDSLSHCQSNCWGYMLMLVLFARTHRTPPRPPYLQWLIKVNSSGCFTAVDHFPFSDQIRMSRKLFGSEMEITYSYHDCASFDSGHGCRLDWLYCVRLCVCVCIPGWRCGVVFPVLYDVYIQKQCASKLYVVHARVFRSILIPTLTDNNNTVKIPVAKYVVEHVPVSSSRKWNHMHQHKQTPKTLEQKRLSICRC